jgi:hypothetical protein
VTRLLTELPITVPSMLVEKARRWTLMRPRATPTPSRRERRPSTRPLAEPGGARPCW